jgi:UDP-N-acetylmuramoylalanine--D-glutamate ligase
MNQNEEDYLIYDADDEGIAEWLKHIQQKQINSFFIDKTFSEGAYIKITKWKFQSIKNLQWTQNTLP